MRKFQWKHLLFRLVLTVMTALSLTGCGNKDMFDTVFTFDHAMIRMPDGSIVEGDVIQWTDYADGDQIQIRIGDKTYLVHSSNAVLIHDNDD